MKGDNENYLGTNICTENRSLKGADYQLFYSLPKSICSLKHHNTRNVKMKGEQKENKHDRSATNTRLGLLVSDQITNDKKAFKERSHVSSVNRLKINQV